MYLCKQPIYNTKLQNVGVNLSFHEMDSIEEKLFEFESIFASVLETINECFPLFIPYQYYDLFGKIEIPNPLIYVIDASDIGSKYQVDDIGYQQISIALYMRQVSDLAYLNLVDYVGLSSELIENNTVNKLIKYIHDKQHKVIAFDIHDQKRFRTCSQLSLDYYCGSFLHQPDYEKSSVSANKLNLLKLVNQLQDEDVSFLEVSEIINNDPALSYELLKVANSAAFAGNKKVESIQQAVVRMGFLNLKNLMLTIAMKNVSERPIELIESGLIRAHMCQSIATHNGVEDAEMYYTAGLLSIIDVLLDKPMESLLKHTDLIEEVKAALLSRDGEVGQLLNNVINYEQACWDEVDLEQGNGVDWCKVYIDSMNTANHTVRAMMH